ncbi:MAG: amidohydrolase family protein, partial [Saprospiraceae bacterium]|nr:amidohydrolase family protein [Saprospiraceae bacterium]
DLVPTCLAAHIKPPTWPGDNRSYLASIAEELLPRIKAENLSDRVDIFIEESAFSKEEGADFLKKARNLAFKITVHADQFSSGGSALGRIWDAVSADHLEAINAEDIRLLAESNTVATVLPNASLGLGIPFAPARRLLDAGAILAIASDWNPGSAPMGDLITGAALLSAYEKLSTAEVLAGLTFRAAQALSLTDRGMLQQGKLADMQSYAVTDYREILYHQGQLTPHRVWKKGELLYEA